MPFAVGTDVVVRNLGNKRGVVEEASAKGLYRVRVAGLIVSCREADLTLADTPKRRGRGRLRVEAPVAAAEKRVPAGRVDLHGLTIEEALARLIAEIDRALQRGADRVEVVHGKGSGRIKHAVHRYLSSMSVVAAYRLDPHNAGVTWIYF